MSVPGLTLRRSWVAAIPALLVALISGSLVRALLAGGSVFIVVLTVVLFLTYLQVNERRRWGAAGRPGGTPGSGGIAGTTGLPTSYTGGHYPVDHPGEGGELRRRGIYGPPDPGGSIDEGTGGECSNRETDRQDKRGEAER